MRLLRNHPGWLRILPLLSALVVPGGGTILAQTLTVLHTFAQQGDEGAFSRGKLLISGNTMYGTAAVAGTNTGGTVFKMNLDGSGFAVVYSFKPNSDPFPNYGGTQPYAGVTLAGDTLYGETISGGYSDRGAVFKVKTDGNGFDGMYSFTGQEDSSSPAGGLTLSGNTLYGTTGLADNGTVFAISTDGSDFRIVHAFPPVQGPGGTNLDGSRPLAGVILASDILYGTTSKGGVAGNGTVFAMSTFGTGFRVLHTFAALSGIANPDGANPASALTLVGNALYGTTQFGGKYGGGSIYKVNTDGTGFTNLHDFSGALTTDVVPPSGLVLFGNSLYGTTQRTIFKINPDGSGFKTIYTFAPVVGAYQTNQDGAFPWADMTLVGNTLYGTASGGGIGGNGTVFALHLPVTVQLSISSDGQNVLLKWPTNGGTLNLQSCTDLSSPSWTPISSPPMVVDGQNVVTNPVSEKQQFFRFEP